MAVQLRAFSKGLVVASESGYFGIWHKNEDNDNINNDDDYKLVYLRGWSSDRFYGPAGMDIFQETLLSVSFKNNDIATFDLNKILPNNITENVE